MLDEEQEENTQNVHSTINRKDTHTHTHTHTEQGTVLTWTAAASPAHLTGVDFPNKDS